MCASVRNCVVDESVSLHKGCLCLMIASRQLTASCEAVGHNRQLFRCSCISTSASRQQLAPHPPPVLPLSPLLLLCAHAPSPAACQTEVALLFLTVSNINTHFVEKKEHYEKIMLYKCRIHVRTSVCVCVCVWVSVCVAKLLSFTLNMHKRKPSFVRRC